MREDRIISALIGLVGACNNNTKTTGTDSLVIKALAFPLLCPEYDEKALRQMIDDIRSEKNSVAPGCAVCAAPCGNTSDYDMHRIYEADDAIRKVKLQILEKIQQLAAYACYNQEHGIVPYIDGLFFYKALSYVSYDIDEAELLGLLNEAENIERDIKSGGLRMIRKIIKIDENRCNGCGACAAACHEGAIEIIRGKAVLTREDYCDGLGDCLPKCPAGAISFEEREAPAYDEAAVHAAKQKEATSHTSPGVSQLGQWPCQIKLAPVNAPYFSGAKLLIAADCTAYAYANIHGDFMKSKVTLIGCPKLDSVDYSEKLTEIIRNNDIKSVTILRMEVPCCGGLELAAQKALQESGKFIPWHTITVSIDGNILDD